jgi:molybdopterin synthase catalytic subunit
MPMALPRLAIVRSLLSIETLSAAVEAEARARGGEGSGALASFVGVVRPTHQGRVVRYLDYEAFEPLALKVFSRIEAEIAAQWPAATLGLAHRVGRLDVGEASVAIVVATPHRAQAFQACRYAIERVKQIAPVWKHEFFDGGESWVEGAVADPDDEVARSAALAAACA